FKESYLGLALAELRHVENLPQRFPIVAAVALIAAAALALGRLVVRALGLTQKLSLGEQIALAYGLGTTALGVITLVIGRLGLLPPWPIRLGLAAIVLVEGALLVLDRRGRVAKEPGSIPSDLRDPPDSRSSDWLGLSALILGAGPFVPLMALG